MSFLNILNGTYDEDDDDDVYACVCVSERINENKSVCMNELKN